jgi:peptide/nickel transport system ATP-binding protein
VTETLLDVRGLAVSFPARSGETRVIDDFFLQIAPHEIVGLVGESGSGKSTVAVALMGLVRHPGRIAEGEIIFEGRDLLTLDDEELRRVRGKSIAMITQQPRQSLNPLLSVGRQINTVYRAHNEATREEADRRAVDLLEMVGINDPERRVSAYPHELSGGMAQRALIAMALSSAPRLLIADEPTSGLDVTIQAQFLDEMWDSVQATGSAVLLVTQDLGIIANYCDRVVVMGGGAVIEDAPVRTFFASPQHEYSQRILSLQRARPHVAPDDSDGGTGPLMAVSGLRKVFELEHGEELTAVSGVDFAIPRGRTLGLVGESGSGKTTVGRALLRLAEPTAGSISFDGQSIENIDMKSFRGLRDRLQVVFQDPFDSLNPRWTIEKIMREPLDLHTELSPDEKKTRVMETLDMVGLPTSVAKLRSRRLSAGQQQRVSIGRALITQPDFIVLDEPTSALPAAARAEIIDLIARLQRELGISYLYISHDLTTVEYLCHDVAVMYLSQIVEHGTREQVFGDPQHPYSRALLASHLFPDPAYRRVDRAVRETLSGEIPSPIDLPVGCYLAGRCPVAVPECRTVPQELITQPDGRKVRCWRITEGDLDWTEFERGEAV